MKDEKVAGVAGGFFGAICISGSYLHGRARYNEKTMRGRGGERLLPTTPLPPFSGWTSFRLSHDCISYLPTTKEKQNNNNKKTPAVQPGQGKRGRFGVNNSVVAGVPFPPFLACPNSPFSQPSFQGCLLVQRRPHVH